MMRSHAALQRAFLALGEVTGKSHGFLIPIKTRSLIPHVDPHGRQAILGVIP